MNQAQHDASRATAQGTVSVEYPEPNLYNITVSGNGSVQVIPSEKGLVSASKNEIKSASERSNRSFSLDEFVKSVPQWLWPVMIFGLIGLIAAYIVWTKATAAGRAADSALSGTLEVLEGGIHRLKSKLAHHNPESESWRSLKAELETLEEERAHQLDGIRKRGKRRYGS